MKHQLHGEDNLRNSDCLPAVNGGYITVYLDESEIHIASVPSFNLMAEKYRDSMVDNMEEFVDKDGNEYVINICSSNVGVDWDLEIYPKNEEDRSALVEKIRIEYESNQY
jgi:hypothetical protein